MSQDTAAAPTEAGLGAPPAVAVEGLVKAYGRVRAADGLSFAVPRGSVTALLGPNGAGKTTTVECCEGYRSPDGGSVRVLGLDPVRDGARLRPRVGVMLQEGGGVYPGARALEMLRHLARLHAHPLDVGELAARLGIDAFGRTPFRRLSGGQRQRLALAMAVVGRPEVVFLDEPTAGLDPQARHATWELVRSLRADGVAVVLTTHLMDEAERLADSVVIVDHGRVVAAGTPAQLTTGGASADAAPAALGAASVARDPGARAAAGAANVAGHVRFDAPPGLDLGSLGVALRDGVRVSEPSPGRYHVDGRVDPALLARLAAWCMDRGVLLTGLDVGRRTLEDVFLDLTGRELRG